MFYGGTVTIARDLVDQKVGFQEFVIVHELLHLRIPNHGRLFKALMNIHVPAWRRFDVLRRHSLKVPASKAARITNRWP
jgi:predicted metal-dependent hydrolase